MSDNETDNQEIEEQPRYYVELVEEIISQLENFFSTHLEDMFKQADDHLFSSANEASTTAEQNNLFECMNAIRVDKVAIQKSFIEELGSYLQPVADLEELPEKKQSKKPDTLSLVEQNEMDEMVILATMSSKAAMDNSEAISHLIKRFKELSQYNDHIFHAEALEPKRLCDAMHDAVGESELIDSNKLVVYQFFNKALISDLGELYSLLNNLLIEQGILPEIDYSGMVPHYEHEEYDEAADEAGMTPEDAAQPPPGGRRAFGSGMPGGMRPPGMPMQGGPPPMRPPGGGYAPQGGGYAPQGGGYAQQGGEFAPQGGGQAPQGGGYPSQGGGGGAAPRRAFGSGMSSFAQAPAPTTQGGAAAPGGPAGQDSAQSSGPMTGPAGQAYSAGRPVGEVRQSIENFVGGSQADVVSGAGQEGYYSHQQVMTALSGLQAPAGDISQTPLVFDANQIKKAVLSSIGEADGGAVTKAVHQVSEKTIDFIKLIFDAIIDEESITDEIKTLLLSLQIPVIKAAMIDSDFFVDDQHPARQLLDKIAEAGVGVDQHTDPVYIEIEKVVRKLLQDYDEDVVAFTVALDELKELTEEIYRKARETEAESQKVVKMAHAKGIVLQEIRKITIGKELPEGIRTLVLKIWPSMMFNHYLSHGKANDEWVELLMILQKIIESVQPLHSVAELEELGLSHRDIVDAARSKLQKSYKKQATIDQVITSLEDTYETLMASIDVPDEDEPQLDSELIEPTADELTEESAEQAAATEEAEELSLEPEEAQVEPEPEEAEDPEVIAKAKIGMLPDGVSPGAWFIVYNGEDKPVRRLKLAVILVQDATMVFVDHLGNVVIEKDAEMFAQEIDKGLSGIIMQHSVFDHALSSALGSIEH